MSYLTDNTVISNTSGSAGGDFLRISDKKPGDDIAVDGKSPAQTAKTLENIFSGFSPLSAADILSQDALSDFLKGKYAGPEGLQRLADDVGVADLCPSTMAPTGKRTVPVYVHASTSSIFENYDLVSYGSAKAGPTIIEDTVDKTFEFNNAAFISLGYNLRSDGYSARFFGVTDQEGKSIGGDPVYSVSAQGIHLHGNYSGTVKITGLQIVYHVWDITLAGIALGDGKRLYSGRASVISTAYRLGPYHQKIGGDVKDDAAAQCPFDDTDFIFGDPGQAAACFIQIQNEVLGRCSGELLKPISYTYKSTPCPPGVVPQWNNPSTYNYNPALPEYYKILEYVTSRTYEYDGGQALTAEEYNDICCDPPVKASCIPPCRNIKSIFYGVDIDGGREKYIKEYGGKTIFVPVGTKAGPCGTLTDKFIDSGSACCLMPRIVFELVDNWVEILQDGAVILYSSNVPIVPFTVFLNKKTAVEINLYNWPFGPSPWEIKYQYFVGENIVDTVSESGDDYNSENNPVWTKSFRVCGL